MAAQRRLRLAMLEHELAQARLQQYIILAALLEEVDRERHMTQRRRRRWWVRDWILRRPLFGLSLTFARLSFSFWRHFIKEILRCVISLKKRGKMLYTRVTGVYIVRPMPGRCAV